MSLQSEIRKIASRLPIGTGGYFTCPKCGRRSKIGITNNVDAIIYQCFSASCGLRGKLPNQLSKDTIGQILNKKVTEGAKHTFQLPDYLIDGFASENSVIMASRYDLLEPYSKGYFKTAYDPRLNRQVFFHLDSDQNIVGAMGRALHPKVLPKAYIYPNTIKTPYVVGTASTGVLVEDILSAIRISALGYVGIALSGTTLQAEYLPLFKPYTKLHICLDKDASIKSIDIKKLLDFYCSDVIITLIEKDFKDMTREEARKILS